MRAKTHTKSKAQRPKSAAALALYEIAKRLLGMAQGASKGDLSFDTQLPKETLIEWLARSAANRAYYAAYHEVTRLLETCLRVDASRLRHSSMPDKFNSYIKNLKRILRKQGYIDEHERKLISKTYICRLEQLSRNYNEMLNLREISDYRPEANIIGIELNDDICSFSSRLTTITKNTMFAAQNVLEDQRLRKYL